MNKIYYNITSVITDGVKFVFFMLLSQAIIFADGDYDLDEFDDLELQSLDKRNEKYSNENKNKQLILFDDNLYLLNDDFDFGEDELELQKLELDPDDMETAKEYEDFLNAFFENATSLGISTARESTFSTKKMSKKSKANRNFARESSIKTPKRSKNTSLPTQSHRPSRGALGFGVSTIVGATIPVTMNGFSTGSNFGIRINTPFSFNLAGMEANVGTDIYFSSFNSKSDENNFKITNIVGNVALFPLSSIEIRAGLGLTPLSIGDYSVTALSIPIDINYYLPMNLSGFSFALNLHAQRTLGYPPTPGSTDGDATDFIYIGLLVNTPIAF